MTTPTPLSSEVRRRRLRSDIVAWPLLGSNPVRLFKGTFLKKNGRTWKPKYASLKQPSFVIYQVEDGYLKGFEVYRPNNDMEAFLESI